MHVEVVKVEVENLKVGMYVSELDRPWLETPFLFQGFYVRGPDDIHELRKYCDYVYTDVAKSRISDQQKAAIYVKPSALQRFKRSSKETVSGIFGLISRLLLLPQLLKLLEPDPGKRQLDLLKVELAPARDSYERANHDMSKVMDGMRNGKKLNLPKLQQNADFMLDSIMRNPYAMVWLNRMKYL